MGKLALFEKIIKTYSKGELYNNIYKSSKKFLTMPSVFSDKKVVQVPLSSFTRTSNGDIVLYRGLKTQSIDITDGAKSVAATLGKTKKEILSSYKGSKLDIARDFSGLTQGKDPMLHTTTKRKIAKSFADNGMIIEYHIPQTIKVHSAPCHIPVSKNTMPKFLIVFSLEHLFPPKEI